MQSSHKKRSGQFQDTTYLYSADKSLVRAQTEDYLNRTPVRNQYISSASKNKNSRTSQAKRAIDDVIDMIADKRRLNQEAISQIKNVNNQIATNLNGANKAKVEQKRKTSEQFKNSYGGQNIATSLFDWRQSHNELENSRKESEVSQQNLNLRSRLNEEIRRNNQLYQYVASLQEQNEILKSSRQETRDNTNVNSLIEQNRRLREQLHAQQGGFLQQLQTLKQENSLLRKETINLLKNKSP